jgi:hypothetical protein
VTLSGKRFNYEKSTRQFNNMELGKYSFGIGDRFARQGEAQLEAFVMAREKGLEITPVWNKSNREHLTIGSDPRETRAAADNAVSRKNWDGAWFVDADHINMGNVDKFIESSDFFTIDVADFIGKKASDAELEEFAGSSMKFTGRLSIPGIGEPFSITRDSVYRIGEKFLYAVKEAGKIYRHIEVKKRKRTVHNGDIHGRGQRSPVPDRAVFHTGCHSGRKNSGEDYRTEIQREVQQGSGLPGRYKRVCR